MVGSNDEPTGNKTCRATVGDDAGQTVTLDLFLGETAGHLVLPGLRLAHGHPEWVAAIEAADAEFAVSRA